MFVLLLPFFVVLPLLQKQFDDLLAMLRHAELDSRLPKMKP